MTRRRFSGFALQYSLIAMIALTGISSLAIDYGHAQMVKVQLRRAADAAARYGATGLTYDSATAISRATTSAGENSADGTPVVATAQTGHWDSTTRVFTANAAPMDAIQVSTTRTVPMLFAKLLGQKACSVTASAVCLNKAVGPNFVGLNSVTAKNNTALGYDSSHGAPSASNTNSGFLMGSNGTVSFNNNLTISGGVILGPNGTLKSSATTPMISATPLSYPSTENPPYVSSGNLKVTGTLHISGGGTLVYTDINFANNAQLIFDAPTTLYVTGSVNAAQGSIIKPASDIPGDLKIRMTGGASSVFGGPGANNISVTALVYAPATDFSSLNNATLYGSMLFRTIYAQNNLNAYYDVASGSVISGTFITKVTMVQ